MAIDSAITTEFRRIGVCVLIAGLFIVSAQPAQGARPPVTDLGIKDAVEDELSLDKAIDSEAIDITVTEGVVALNGLVENLLAKERAADIAATVRGVRSVVNDLTVAPSVIRTDEEIRQDIKDSLLLNPATESFEVHVSVEKGRVMLTGTVTSWQEKQLAETVAKSVRGVSGVENKIEINYSETRSDRQIQADIAQRLKWDTLVDDALIDVSAEDGTVTLTGVVGSAAEKSRALGDAWVAGVTSVDASGLEVKQWARDEDLRKGKYTRKTDEQIQEAVQDGLFYDPQVNSLAVTVEAEDGVVTLRGAVESLAAREAAAQTARNTVGVISVENRLKVKPSKVAPDQKVEERVQRALSRHPYVNEYEIVAEVTNGVVDLYGVVNSYFEKSQAESVTSRVSGVLAVDNRITVERDQTLLVYEPYLDDPFVYDKDWYHPGPRITFKSDRQIKEDIRDEFFWSPFVDGEDIRVQVDAGVATLTGTVASWSEYYAATENGYEGGAVLVDNDLVVVSTE